MSLVAGVFVGGASRRMGGRPKGLLLAPESGREGNPRVSVVERTVALARERCAEVVLVGRAEAYAALGIPAIADATTASGAPIEGPLAGLVALLEHAGARSAGAIALACDMPYVTSAMIERLATFAMEAEAVAARVSDPRISAPTAAALTPGPSPTRGEGWSPFFARYDAARVASVARAKLEAGERSLRVVLESVDVRELPLSPEEQRALRDWDSPGDVDDMRTG